MKKLLLSMAGMLTAALPSLAQSYSVNQTGITSAENLIAGDYVIYAIPDGTSKQKGYVNYSQDGISSRHYLTYPLDVTTHVSDPNYVWTVTKTTEGHFEIALKNDPSIYWIDDEKWGQNMTGATNKAVLIGENSDDNSGIYFKPAEEMNNDQNALASDTYLNCNGPLSTNYTSLSYWGGKTEAAKFVFYQVTETSPYPFEFSEAPTTAGFAANTTWYYLTLSDKYIVYNEKQAYCSAASSTISSNYGNFWAFVKTGTNQIEIYNAAAGPEYVLASSSPVDDGKDGGNTHPTLQKKDALADGITATWNVKYNSGDDFFYLSRPDEANSFFNNRDDKLSFWTDTRAGEDDGSKLKVVNYNLTSIINAAKEEQAAVSGAVGTMDSKTYEQFISALEKNNLEGLIEALKIRDLTGTTVPFDATKYYRLQNVKFGGIFGINPESMSLKKETAMDPSNANLLFKFEEGDNGNVKIYHPNAKLYVGTAGSGESVPLKEASEASEYTKLDWGTGNFGFMNASNLDIVQFGENGNIGLYINSDGGGKGGDHAWYLIPAEEIDVNITAAGYATVNYPFAVQVPAGIKAYTGSLSAEKNVLNLNEIAGGIIPANTPVVLEGAEGTYSLTILADNPTPAIEGNALKGVLLSQEIVADKEPYVLGNVESTVGFYKVTADDRILAANKAYIELPSATAQGIRSIVIGGTTTGIEDTVAEGTETEEYYDLQGRRVLNPTKGIYVTKSGKKVLFNK